MLQQLLNIETQEWRALSSSPQSARQYYDDLLCDDAVMLFPGGLVLAGKNEILESLSAQPWQGFEIETPRCVRLGDAAAVLSYKVTAQREGSTEYSALISSAYCRTGGTWLLAFHQHTPT